MLSSKARRRNCSPLRSERTMQKGRRVHGRVAPRIPIVISHGGAPNHLRRVRRTGAEPDKLRK